MQGAGALKDLVTFQKRALDANGDALGAWEAGFSTATEITYLRGTEPVMAQRLKGVQPVILTVHEYGLTRQITTASRAVNARNVTQVFEIRNCAPAKKPGFLDILAEMTVEAAS